MGDIFWVAKISNMFSFFGGGVLGIPDIFGVNGRCRARAYV